MQRIAKKTVKKVQKTFKRSLRMLSNFKLSKENLDNNNDPFIISSELGEINNNESTKYYKNMPSQSNIL